MTPEMLPFGPNLKPCHAAKIPKGGITRTEVEAAE